MARKKTTMYIDEDLLRAVKVTAAREGRREYEVVEEALDKRLGVIALLESIWARQRELGLPDLSEDEAMSLANEAKHESRRRPRPSTRR